MVERVQHREEEPRGLNKSHFNVEVQIGAQSCNGELIVFPLGEQSVESRENTQITEILFLYPDLQSQALDMSRELVEGFFLEGISLYPTSRFGFRQERARELLPDGFFYRFGGIVWEKEPWRFRDRIIKEGFPREKGGRFSLAFSLSRQPVYW